MDALAACPWKVYCGACGKSATLSLRIWICEETTTCPNYYICDNCYRAPDSRNLPTYLEHTTDHVLRQHVYDNIQCDCCQLLCSTSDRRWRCQVCSIDVCDVCYYELWYFLDRGLLPQHNLDSHQMVAVEPILDSDPIPLLSEWSIDYTTRVLRVIRKSSRTGVVASGKSSEADEHWDNCAATAHKKASCSSSSEHGLRRELQTKTLMVMPIAQLESALRSPSTPGVEVIRNMLKLCKAILSIDGNSINELTRMMEELSKCKYLEDMESEDMGYVEIRVSGLPVAHGQEVSLTRIWAVRQIFQKLGETPSSQFAQNQLEDFLMQALNVANVMKLSRLYECAEAVLQMRVSFASKVGDDEVKTHLLAAAEEQLFRFYESTGQYAKATQTEYFKSISQRASRQLPASNEVQELLNNCIAAISLKETNYSEPRDFSKARPGKTSRPGVVVVMDHKDLETGSSRAVSTQFNAVQYETIRKMLELCKAILSIDGNSINELTKKMDELSKCKSPEDMEYVEIKVSGLPSAHDEHISLTRIWAVRQVFQKVVKMPYNQFSQKQLNDFLMQALNIALVMRNFRQYDSAFVVLELGRIFALKVEDAELKTHLLSEVESLRFSLYLDTKQYQKAAEMDYYNSNSYLRRSDSRQEILNKGHTANIWSLAGDHRRALEIITTTCSAIGDAEGDWRIEAFLKFMHGRILFAQEQTAEALDMMNKATDLCLCSSYDFDDDILNSFFLEFLGYYQKTVEYDAALSFLEVMDPVLLKIKGKHDSFVQKWNISKGRFLQSVHDQSRAQQCWSEEYEKGQERSEEYEKGQDRSAAARCADGVDDAGGDGDEDEAGSEDDEYLRVYCGDHTQDPRSYAEFLFQVALLQVEDEEAALKALDAAIKIVNLQLDGDIGLLGLGEMLRGEIFNYNKNHVAEKKAYEKAVEIFEKMNQTRAAAGGSEATAWVRDSLSLCYGRLSELGSGNLSQILRLVGKAAVVLERDNLAMYYYIVAQAQFKAFYFREAAIWAAKAAAHFIKDLEPKHLRAPMTEKTWVRIFEGQLLSALRLNESVSLVLDGQNPSLEAFSWAERCRMRVYMRITEGIKLSQDFDSDRKSRDKILRDVVLMCGEETAIIFYSLGNCGNDLRCYLIYKMADQKEVTVFCSGTVDLKDHLAKWNRKGSGKKTLTTLVSETVLAMKDKERSHRMETRNLLSILHSILIKPVEKQLPKGCTNLVISPEGTLSMFPFGALFDDAKGEFLIQQKAVTVVPSIRALLHCFQHQHRFEEGWKELEHPFVAGNPNPMGAKQKNLPGAALEAENVVNILKNHGVRDFSGEKMTKATVLDQGFKRSQVVVLSTHCLVNQTYPQGALVLRRDTNNRLEETLTPNEIVANGAIPAGLVVLSACETGLGEVTNLEGVLGPGRAVLQSGAATTVLTLWKVDDVMTTDLITGMFENLRKGWTVPESLQSSMVKMIHEGKSIYEWAPVFVMGSPKLRLPSYSSQRLPSFEDIEVIPTADLSTPPVQSAKPDLSESCPEFRYRSEFRRIEEKRAREREQDMQAETRSYKCSDLRAFDYKKRKEVVLGFR